MFWESAAVTGFNRSPYRLFHCFNPFIHTVVLYLCMGEAANDVKKSAKRIQEIALPRTPLTEDQPAVKCGCPAFTAAARLYS